MVKAVFFVPKRDNGGQPFRRRQWNDLRRQLRELAGGYTEAASVNGEWINENGVIFQDNNRVFIVTLASWKQLPAWLELVESVRATFEQEAIYGEINGAPEFFK